MVLEASLKIQFHCQFKVLHPSFTEQRLSLLILIVSLKTFDTHCFPVVCQIATSYLTRDRQTETEVGGTGGAALHQARLKLVAGRYVRRQIITYKLQAGTELLVYQRESQKQRGCCHIRQNVFSNTCIYPHRWIEELVAVATPHYLLPGNFNVHLSHYLSSQTSALLVLQVLLEATQCPSIQEQKNPHFQGRNGFPFNYLSYANRCRIWGKISSQPS